MSTSTVPTEKKQLALVGTGIAHGISPTSIFIANSINLPWSFGFADTPDIASFIDQFRGPSWVGAIVTLPHKRTVIPLLDDTDEHVKALKACNGIWKSPEGRIVGTNTDWRGIHKSLVAATEDGHGKPALIIGAGGASRAAVYALSKHLDCSRIYVVCSVIPYRLVQDVREGYESVRLSLPDIVHLTSVDQTSKLPTPYYIVGTVPDFPPQTPSEVLAQDMLLNFLKRPDKGVLLDMCYKPRETRHLRLAKQECWKCVDGVNIIGWQIETQWALWAGDAKAKEIRGDEAREFLYKTASG